MLFLKGKGETKMIAVYKYTLDNTIGRQELLIPQNARILHVGEQNNQITLWAQVNTQAKL